MDGAIRWQINHKNVILIVNFKMKCDKLDNNKKDYLMKY